MASMLHLVGCYITHRRRLGYQLNDASRLLAAFARFCARAAPGRPLTTDLALRWANERPGLKPKTRASRLSMVRGFARYCVALDPRTEVPATRLLCSNWQRGTPHIFTPRRSPTHPSACSSTPDALLSAACANLCHLNRVDRLYRDTPGRSDPLAP